MRNNKFIVALIFVASLFVAACGGSSGNSDATAAARGNSSGAANASATPQTPLETELSRLQRADFRQVFSFARKDGAPFTAEDKSYFREYAPSEQINQRLLTSDQKHIVVGTNYPFTPDQLEALQKRFAAENHTEKYGRKPDPTPTPEATQAN